VVVAILLPTKNQSMRLINEIKQGKLSIEKDCLLSVVCNGGKRYHESLQKLDNIIIEEFKEIDFDFVQMDVSIYKKEIIETYLNFSL